jgi:hypothetical protein
MRQFLNLRHFKLLHNNWIISGAPSMFSVLFFFLKYWDLNSQGLAVARKALYHVSHPMSPSRHVYNKAETGMSHCQQFWQKPL